MNINQNVDSLCLKIYGKDEYLVKNCPLIRYSRAQEDMEIFGKIFLVIKDIDDVILKILPFEKLKLKRSLKRENSTAYQKSLETKKCERVSSHELNEKFKIEIGQLKFERNGIVQNESETWLR